ncbi:MAG TPA: phage head closure protein [Rhodocyclaceae bacterium]|jgi:SPP1 family predicted phage head-tail adaptor
MRAGNLRKRILIQSQSTTPDSVGGQEQVWTDIAPVWGSIETLSGRELAIAQAINTELTHKITVRYRPELADPKIVAALRAVYQGRIFNIQYSDNVDERNREIALIAAEGLNNG